MRYLLESWSRIYGLLAFVGICGALSACGGDTAGPSDTCGAGEFCDCVISSDCPSGEVCDPVLLLCQEGEVDLDSGPDVDAADIADVDAGGLEDTDTASPDTSDIQDLELDGDTDTEVDGSADASDAVDDADTDALVQDTDAEVDAPDAEGSDLEDPTSVAPFPERSTQWIAFQSEPEGRPELWVVKSPGTELTRIVTDDQRLLSPSWSPDGLSVAVIGLSVSTGRSLRVVEVQTGVATTIETGEIEAIDNPTWSWDARYVAFDGRESGAADRDVFVWDTRDSVLTNVTATSGSDENYPSFSYDGQLYFTTSEFGGGSGCQQEFELARIRFSVGEIEQVTDGSCIAGRPALDPEGRFIVTGRLFTDDSSDLVRLNLDEDASTVRFGGEGESSPAVSPDGGTVVFVTTRFGGQDVVLASAADGTVIRRLATSLSDSVNVTPSISGADASTIVIVESGGGT
jgi:Tol biopolymer transport system component